MAVRTTMADLITKVREEIDDTSSTYFTDQQVQDELDKDDCRLYVDREILEVDTLQKTYLSYYNMFEGDASTWSAADTIEVYATPGIEAAARPPDSWNLIDGTFVYTARQTDLSRYLTGWSYDIHRAAGRLFQKLSAKTTITPGPGETGGAIRSRAELRFLAQMQFNAARPVSRQINRVYVG